MKCPVCSKNIDIEGADSKTGETAFGAKEIDSSKGRSDVVQKSQ